MKICVVTPYDEANYGAYLQAYATQKFLSENGYEVVFAEYRSARERRKSFFTNNGNIVARVKKILRYNYNRNNYAKMTKALERFDVTDCSDFEDVALVILGSDEIWNINYEIFQNPVFYGQGFSESRVLAYAPSVGNARVEDYLKYPEIVKLIEKIDVIGVRDENSQKVIHEFVGKSPEIVCDPTLLLDIKQYDIQENIDLNERYVLIYSYSVPDVIKCYLKKFADERGLKLVSACMYQSWCDINLTCEPLEFLSLIKNAEFVFTTTFHGSIFTFLFHKNCAIAASSKKLLDLMSWTGMMSQYVDVQMDYESFSNVLLKKNDYIEFEKSINDRREKSKKLYIQKLNQWKDTCDDSLR